jgi:hypothetical protein
MSFSAKPPTVMTKTLHPVPSERGQLLLDFPIRFYTALRTIRLYPATNPQVQRSNEFVLHLFQALRNQIGEDSISLAVSDQKLLVCGEHLADKDQTRPQIQGLITLFTRTRIHSLSFHPTFNLEECIQLTQTLSSLLGEKEPLTGKGASLEKALAARAAAAARLKDEITELRRDNADLEKTLRTLTSKEDSLARQYLELKNEKEKLDDFAAGVRALRTRLVEEKDSDGFRTGKAEVLVNDLVIGSLEWRIPAAVARGRGAEAEAAFTAESIDYVRATPEEKRVLRSLVDPLRVRIGLEPGAAALRAEAGPGEAVREVRERERSLWTWTLHNQGTRDARLRFSVRLVNRGGGEIELFDREPVLEASDALRRVRDALRPVPLAVGAVLGFLLFGIVGIFRRPGRPRPPAPGSGARSEPGPDPAHTKGL